MFKGMTQQKRVLLLGCGRLSKRQFCRPDVTNAFSSKGNQFGLNANLSGTFKQDARARHQVTFDGNISPLLTETQRKKLEGVNYDFADFKTYLIDVLGLSPTGGMVFAQSQVTKMVLGIGIPCKYWGDGIAFSPRAYPEYECYFSPMVARYNFFRETLW